MRHRQETMMTYQLPSLDNACNSNAHFCNDDKDQHHEILGGGGEITHQVHTQTA